MATRRVIRRSVVTAVTAAAIAGTPLAVVFGSAAPAVEPLSRVEILDALDRESYAQLVWAAKNDDIQFAVMQKMAAVKAQAAKRAAEEATRQEEADRVAAEEAAQTAAEEASAQVAAEKAEAARVAEQAAAEEAARIARETVTDIAVTEMWATSSVNVRSGPSTDHPKVGGLSTGTSVQVNGRANGFYRTTDGLFVSGHYLTDTKPAPRPTPQQQVAPAAAVVVDPTPAAPSYAWTTWVSNAGGQASIDQCAGGLTLYTPFQDFGEDNYYTIHRHCGGNPILTLNMGELVNIKGVGVFRVVDAADVPKYSYYTSGQVGGSAHLQTCYRNSNTMRIVGLEPA